MKKIIFTICLFSGLLLAQTFKVEALKGDIKAQTGTNENWVNVHKGEAFQSNTTILTGEKSSVRLVWNNNNFTLKELSAVSLFDIKKMSLDDLILALAMEDMINAPHKKEQVNSKNTAVYGTEINGVGIPIVKSNNFGIEKLNGAVQLSEAGYKESAVVTSKEIFRKYPGTKTIPSFRIYFANVLASLGLNDDAFDEFNSIKKLNLSDQQKTLVNAKLKSLAEKLLNRH